MCESVLLDLQTGKEFIIPKTKYKFSIFIDGKENVIHEGIELDCLMNLPSVSEVKDSYGVKNGYMWVFGEKP